MLVELGRERRLAFTSASHGDTAHELSSSLPVENDAALRHPRSSSDSIMLLGSPSRSVRVVEVEVLFAQGVAYYSFKQPMSARELLGIVLIVAGVALLVAV